MYVLSECASYMDVLAECASCIDVLWNVYYRLFKRV